MDLQFISEFQGRWRRMASPQSRIYLETIEHFQLRSLLVLVNRRAGSNSFVLKEERITYSS